MMYKTKWGTTAVSSEDESSGVKKVLISLKLSILDIQKLHRQTPQEISRTKQIWYATISQKHIVLLVGWTSIGECR